MRWSFWIGLQIFAWWVGVVDVFAQSPSSQPSPSAVSSSSANSAPKTGEKNAPKEVALTPAPTNTSMPAPAAASTPTRTSKISEAIYPREGVPKQLGLYLGLATQVLNHMPNQPSHGTVWMNGGIVYGYYLWQVGGLGKKWPSWVGFLSGITYLPAYSGTKHTLFFEYGLLVKHALFRSSRSFRPFVAYGLGALQAFVIDVKGRGTGHLTRLTIGFDAAINRWLSFSFEITYKFQMIPSFNLDPDPNKKDPNFDSHHLNLLFGFVFDIAP